VVIVGTNDNIDGNERNGDGRADEKNPLDVRLRRKKIISIVLVITILVSIVVRIASIFARLTP
jgi:hypothetical protein